ncbi:hypothetical protein [Sphingobacterium sp. MYb388]|uniref:hypothetical protein n=1 Tax=Sphingobacterium sp. MYb388 TaxID=2745437 RepID=UPI00309CFDF0
MNILLQAAYKVIDVPVHSCYDIAKDFIVPSLTIFVSVIVVYFGFYLQKRHLNQAKLLQERETKIQNKDILELNNESLITNLKFTIDSLIECKSNLNLDNFTRMNYPKYDSSQCSTIVSIGYISIFNLIDKKNPSDRQLFSSYWNSVSNIPDNFNSLSNYLIYILQEFNRLNNSINDLNHLITTEVSNKIHDAFEPFETYTLDIENVTDPKVKLAWLLKNAVDKLNEDKKGLSATENYLQDLDKIKFDPLASKVITSEFAQNIVRALYYFKSMKSLFETSSTTLTSYISTFQKDTNFVTLFNELLLKKTFDLSK